MLDYGILPTGFTFLFTKNNVWQPHPSARIPAFKRMRKWDSFLQYGKSGDEISQEKNRPVIYNRFHWITRLVQCVAFWVFLVQRSLRCFMVSSSINRCLSTLDWIELTLFIISWCVATRAAKETDSPLVNASAYWVFVALLSTRRLLSKLNFARVPTPPCTILFCARTKPSNFSRKQ